MSETSQQILQRSTLVVRRGPFALGAWTTNQLSPVLSGILRARLDWTCVCADEREVSALVPEPALSHFPAPQQVERGFCVLTLDTPLAWDVVGVLAALSDACARADVPLGAFAAFSRDHLLVPAQHLERALARLTPLVQQVRHLA